MPETVAETENGDAGAIQGFAAADRERLIRYYGTYFLQIPPLDRPAILGHARPDARTSTSTMTAALLLDKKRADAAETIRLKHYTHSVPSGKSHYVAFKDCLVVWSIPANKNIAAFILGQPGNVWELARLWAPDGHEKNLLTQAISAAVEVIVRLERPDALVSYADPNVGHKGGVYRAASWIYHGKSEEVRTYRDSQGNTFARRAFHSGKKGMTKAEIEALGYSELKLPGKERFVKPLTRRARKILTP